MKFKSRYTNRPAPIVLDQAGETSLTRQSEKDNVDINKIMERFNRSGKLPTMQTLPPMFGDATLPDYQTSLEIVNEAKRAFGALSADARKYFNNDPQSFLDAVKAPTEVQKADLLKLGILMPVEPTTNELLTDVVKELKKTPQKAPSA